MANDIIDINVYETTESVSITVNPNLTTVNINKVIAGGVGGSQDLQSVTDIGNTTTDPIIADSFVKIGGTGLNALLDNGSTVALSAIGGATNLTATQTAINFTINSDTGTDATIPLGNGSLAGATLNDYTTAEKNKLSGIATGAEVNVNADWNAVSGDAQILNKPTIPSITNLVPYTGATTDVNLGLNDITAAKLIKDGGTSAQLLAANGDTITAGTNITISGGTISSTGGAGGSSSVNFYLNGSIASNVAGYKQIGATAVIGTGTDFSLVGNGTIAQFLTDVGSPNRLEIPAGAWNFELWLQSSINNSGTNVHIELYKYDGAFTLIATGLSNPISLQTNTTTNLYVTNVAIPQTTLLTTDRLAIRVIASNAVGLHSVTLHTEDSNLCEVITNFVGGVTAINGITQPSQTLVTGTSGNDFAINSSGSTHTFNLPSASATARGVVSTTSQTFAGTKTFTGAIGIITNNADLGIQVNSDDVGIDVNASGIGIEAESILQQAGVFNLASTNTSNIVEFKKDNVLKAAIQNDGKITATAGTATTDVVVKSQLDAKVTQTITNGVTATAPSEDAVFDALALKANDSNVVHLTGLETIAGTKTFSSNIVIPATGTALILSTSSGGTVSGLTTTTYPDLTELSYVRGVTSAIQTQLNAKQATLTLTTTGSSGAATLVGSTLNIPQYSGGGSSAQTGTIIVKSGTSFTTPSTITTATVFIIELVGAGGGGGGGLASANGSGGGGGGYVFETITGLSPSTTYTCAIGTGGNGGAAASSGTAGTSTTLTIGAATFTASGGGFGLGAASSAGGAGGTGSATGITPDIVISGQNGNASGIASNASSGGFGGNSPKGWGNGGSGAGNASAGLVGTGYGGGGSAGHGTGVVGGAGTQGIIYCQYFN